MRQEESCLYYTSRWLLILNWIKEFVKRVLYNKGYATNPFVLGIVPLLVGIMMGWLLGTYGSLVWSLNWTFRSNNTFVAPANDDDDDDIEDEADTKQERDEKTRQSLQSASHTFESGVDPSHIPQHIAVIMDGNRRYGRSKYQNATRGHEEGSKTLLNFIQWCMAEQVQILTVYAFSTENWQRSPLEVTALMDLILTHVEELRTQALEQGICVNVLSTETEPIPKGVSQGIKRLVEDTKDGKNFTLNICLSYGSRGEIVQACQAISRKVQSGAMDIDDISTTTFHQHLLTASCGADPDLILRTSGEYRLSNFLLWQLAYSELFFLDKTWPEVKKEDLIMVIRKFANDRNRRYGK
jgi:undecaprenyl diphosphate synthase